MLILSFYVWTTSTANKRVPAGLTRRLLTLPKKKLLHGMSIHATNPITRRATFWPLQVKDVLAHPLTAHLPRHLADNNFSLFSSFCWPWVWDPSCQLRPFSHMVMERCGVWEHPGGMSALKYMRLGNPHEILNSPLPRWPSLPSYIVHHSHTVNSQIGSVNLPLFLQFSCYSPHKLPPWNNLLRTANGGASWNQWGPELIQDHLNQGLANHCATLQSDDSRIKLKRSVFADRGWMQDSLHPHHLLPCSACPQLNMTSPMI